MQSTRLVAAVAELGALGAERLADVELFTKLLRNGDEPFWLRLRTLLRDKGLDPSTLVLAESFPDDTDFEFGIIITPDRHVFQFGVSWFGDAIENAKLKEWNELTGNADFCSRYKGIAVGLQLVGRT